MASSINDHSSGGPEMVEPPYSEGDIRQRNRYLREFLPAMTAYGLVLALVLSQVDESSTWAPFWYVLPVVPMIGVAVAVYRSVRRSDEYARLLQLESMALGFGAAIIASLVFGFLGVVEVGLGWGPWVIFGVAMATWGISLGLRGGRA